MDQEELIKERDELFEGIKTVFKERAKNFMIGSSVLIILAGLSIYITVYGNMSPILCALMCACILALISSFMFWINKIIKANNAQDFLTIYDKPKQMMKWMNIVLFSLLAIASLIELISKKDISDLLMIAGIALATSLFSKLGSTANMTREKQEDFKNDIQRLRELVQLTSNKV